MSRVIVGTEGDDNLFGLDTQRNVIYGLGGDDTIHGGVLRDSLVSGAGHDTLFGGAGKDVFFVRDVIESPAGSPDNIEDLKNSDRINLAGIDADTTLAGDQSFHLVSGGLTGHAGELTLVYDKVAKETVILGDVDGDGQADVEIRAHGHHLDFTNFTL